MKIVLARPVQSLDADDSNSASDGSDPLARERAETQQQEGRYMAGRQASVNKAFAAVTDPAASDAAKQEEMNVRWRAAHEAYEQAAYNDIQAEDANNTAISDEGQQHFNEIANESASVMGVSDYEDLLNASYAEDAERTKRWKGQLTSVPAPPPPAAERSAAITLHSVAAPAPADAAAEPSAAPAPRALAVGDNVVAKDNFLYRAGGMLAMHAGETASVLSTDPADGARLPLPARDCACAGSSRTHTGPHRVFRRWSSRAMAILLRQAPFGPCAARTRQPRRALSVTRMKSTDVIRDEVG